MNMEILFCGLMYDDQKEKAILDNSRSGVGLPVAANVFQSNLIQGFYDNGCTQVCGLNSLPVGTWPKQYSKMILAGHHETVNGLSCFETPTLNIVGLKQISRFVSARRALKDYINSHENAYIVTYNFYLPYYLAINSLNKKKMKFKVCTIVTDLPNEFGIVTEKGIRKILANLIGKISMKLTKVTDSFVLLTEQMKLPLEIGNRPYVVVEGFAQIPKNNESVPVTSKRTIVYTGTMTKKFGVLNLVEAFERIKEKDVELHLYGTGDMDELLREKAEHNHKIKFRGSVSRDKVLDVQKRATILVNPRGNNEEYTKYSFPSKTMEYFISGRPVAGFYLDGMPEEYRQYLLCFDKEDVESISQKLDTFLNYSDDELNEIGRRTKEFAIKNKNYKIQTRRIIDLLQG